MDKPDSPALSLKRPSKPLDLEDDDRMKFKPNSDSELFFTPSEAESSVDVFTDCTESNEPVSETIKKQLEICVNGLQNALDTKFPDVKAIEKKIEDNEFGSIVDKPDHAGRSEEQAKPSASEEKCSESPSSGHTQVLPESINSLENSVVSVNPTEILSGSDKENLQASPKILEAGSQQSVVPESPSAHFSANLANICILNN